MPSRLRGLEGLDWTAFLGAQRPVPVLNDAHAALLGECWTGAARGLQNVVMLTLGTGVGGAAMVPHPTWWLFWTSAALTAVGGLLALATNIFEDWY